MVEVIQWGTDVSDQQKKSTEVFKMIYRGR